MQDVIKNNKKVKYIDLAKKIKSPIFSLQDLKLLDLKVYPYQISNWVDKGYIIKLKNGIYVFADKAGGLKSEFLSFNIYQPSYVSLEWALSRYGLIPEMVYNCTAITTKTTRTYENKFGMFIYRNVKLNMFFGYKKVDENGQAYLIAEVEKALIDYVYLNMSKIKTESDVEELRLNEFELKKMDKKKLKQYLKIIGNKRLDATIELILK